LSVSELVEYSLRYWFSTLRTANEKIRKKRIQKRSYVPRGVPSTPAEVLQERSSEVIQVVRRSNEIQGLPDPPLQRAPSMCSIYRSLRTPHVHALHVYQSIDISFSVFVLVVIKIIQILL